jgi:YidC/Oxa1 family membrane protein insertase
MDSQRLILFFVFSFSVFLLVDAWQRDQRPAAQQQVAATKSDKSPASADQLPAPTPSAKLPPPSATAPAPVSQAGVNSGEVVRVETDVMSAEIGSVGGDLRRLAFKQHGDTIDRDKPFVLLEVSPGRTYVAQAGLLGEGMPNHHTQYQPEAQRFSLQDGQNEVTVRLTAKTSSGAQVTKFYRFHRGSYLIDVGFEIVNADGKPIEPHAYFQLVRDGGAPAGVSKMLPTFTGMAVYTEKEKFKKLTFEDVAKGKSPDPKSANDGWIAMLQHYFFSAWLPKNGVTREYYAKKLADDLYSTGVIVPVGAIAPGASGSVTVGLYAGPEQQKKLAEIAPGLDLTIDYGWLTVIAVPLFWVLSWLHQLVGNWGVAIILLTILIKALFYPLSAAGYRSMAKMRVLAPKMQRLKEQYGDDRQRLQQAMMEMYKTEKINPLGGCMPIVIQIPVFIALYWVLLASVELRHAPFMLWIVDLSAKDPYYVLPVLMGATMIIQSRLNPDPPDPVQAKIMKIMPLVFSIFFFFFPAGLVLYWLVNNVLSIAQQWHITRMLEREAKAPRKA